MPLISDANLSLPQGTHGQGALRQLLLQSLTQLRLRNPSYSLRSLARKIECSPAALSEILNNKRRVSAKLAGRIVDRLGIDPVEKKRVLDLFVARNGGQAKSEELETQYSEIATDQFRAVSEWYHFAILSLAETKDFRDDPRWIADRLNVRLPEIVTALERLERLGMLHRDKRGTLEPSGKQFATTDEIAFAALRGYHSEILELARNSLERDGLERRDFTTMTMAVDPVRLVQAKKMIRQFRAKLCDYLERGERTEVYQLSVNLFPLSRQNDANGITK
jgi:uncharacterized protein (TIGR02147 family)